LKGVEEVEKVEEVKTNDPLLGGRVVYIKKNNY